MQRFETLEGRRLLAGVTITFSTDKAGGIVRIAGTGGNDVVDVAFFGSSQIRITDGITTQDFDKAAVSRLTFVGGAGNDKITVGRVQVKAYLDGGTGNDSLSASAGIQSDTLFGGEGNDYLYAGPGDDTLDGGNGGDFQIGNDGNDFLQTKSEVDTDDTVSGGKGNDTVSLATYANGTLTTIGKRNPGLQLNITDTLYGDVENLVGSGRNDEVFDFSNRGIRYSMGDGDDAVFAGLGPDTIIGGDGRDSLNGNDGNDVFDTEDNAIDSVIGGAGTDSVAADDNDILKGVETNLLA